MADEEELEYLQPGFDPSSLTVARLRGILVQYEIPYPSSAKKPDLVAIFNEQLLPRARKILKARSRIQRTSRGITDMPSSQEGTENGDVEEPSISQAIQTPRRRARSSRQSTAETIESTPIARKTPGRKKASIQSRASDVETVQEEDEEPITTRKARRSDRSEIKVEDPDTPPRRSRIPDSVFSDDNPFQSGSSPPSEDRRRSSGVRSEKRKSSSKRRVTDDSPVIKEEDDDVVATSSRSLRLPSSRHSHMSVKVEPGEEFTPDEQLALEQDESTGGAIIRRPRRPRRTGAASAFWTVLMAVFIGYGFFWRKEKIELGYCGVGKRITAMQEYDAPEWLSFLQPVCEPCPAHASCYADMRVTCDNDFVLRQHPLALNGAIPLPPTCEPDGEKVRKVQAVAEKAIEELRERKAKFECGELTEEGTPVASPEIEETSLKSEVSAKRRRGMSEEEFEDLWKGAIGEIIGREEVTSDRSGLTGSHRLSSTSLARLSISCAVRRSALLALARYRVEVAGLVTLITLALFVRNYIRTLRRDSARVPALVSMTLDRLATQAALHNQGSRAEPWMSAGRLRDDVLREEFSTKRREDIWRRVQAVVEANANVRSSVREDRNGEVSRVWEWIGSLPEIEEDRRRSGRYSLLSDTIGTPDQRLSVGAGDDRGDEGFDGRTWDEGRPIY